MTPRNDANKSATVHPDSPEIVVENLHKSFGETHVLRGVNLIIEAGELVAIVGASGSGKTVLLEHMIGMMTPDEGRILVADHDREGAPLVDLAELDQEALDRLRMHWAIVFQRNALFTGTVYDNIAIWLREVKQMPEAEIERIATDAVRAVGLTPETVLDQHRDELSGGMAKRVAGARAVAMNPDLIFYDEPTTGLDPRHAGQIQDLIVDMHIERGDRRQNRTTVIITHDKDLLHRLRPRIIMLHEGGVHFDGPFEAFESSPSEIIQPYFHLMQATQEDLETG